MIDLSQKKLIILDRDGVINVDNPNSVRSVAEFHMIPGVAETIAHLNKMDKKVVLATNQAVVGRGHITEDTLHDIHTYMMQKLLDKDGHLDHIYYNTDHNPSHHRKPGPGMLEDALKDFECTVQDAIFIGDSFRDYQAAAALKMDFILVRTGHGEETLQKLEDESIQVVTLPSLASLFN